MKNYKYIFTILFVLIISVSESRTQELAYSGDITAVSTYVWRGVKQFDGMATQGSFGVSYRAISIGLWYSSFNYDADAPFFETDPFIEMALPSGPVSSALGLTLYSYDFSEYNSHADVEYELYAKLGYDLFSAAVFYIPNQNSLKNEVNESTYWTDISATVTRAGVDWTLQYQFGNYSSRFLATPKKEPVGFIVFNATRPLVENVSLGWNYALSTSKGLPNSLWLSVGVGF